MHPWPIHLHVSDIWEATGNEADTLGAGQLLEVARAPGTGLACGHSGGHWDKAYMNSWNDCQALNLKC